MSTKLTVENVYLRQDAVQLTRRHFWPLLGMSVIFTIITNGLGKALTAVGDQLLLPEVTELMTQYSYLLSSERLTSSEPFQNSLFSLFTSPKFWLFNLLYMIVTNLVRTGLRLGRTKELIDTARGGSPAVGGVFGLMKYCLKAWAVDIWCTLKTLAWMLPGVGVMLLGSFLAGGDTAGIGNMLMAVGSGLIIGLVIPTLIRYAMSTSILADDPSRGIRECVKRSAGMMKDRKWQLFKLGVPVWLKIIGASFVATMIGSALESLLTMDYELTTSINSVLVSVASIYFFLQLDVLYALFYVKRSPAAQAPAAPQPISSWLQEHTATDIENEAAEDEAESTVVSPAQTDDGTKEDAP